MRAPTLPDGAAVDAPRHAVCPEHRARCRSIRQSSMDFGPAAPRRAGSRARRPGRQFPNRAASAGSFPAASCSSSPTPFWPAARPSPTSAPTTSMKATESRSGNGSRAGSRPSATRSRWPRRLGLFSRHLTPRSSNPDGAPSGPSSRSSRRRTSRGSTPAGSKLRSGPSASPRCQRAGWAAAAGSTPRSGVAHPPGRLHCCALDRRYRQAAIAAGQRAPRRRSARAPASRLSGARRSQRFRVDRVVRR